MCLKGFPDERNQKGKKKKTSNPTANNYSLMWILENLSNLPEVILQAPKSSLFSVTETQTVWLKSIREAIDRHWLEQLTSPDPSIFIHTNKYLIKTFPKYPSKQHHNIP